CFVLRGNREARRIVLRLGQVRLADPPELARADPRREPAGELRAVDQPVGLRVAADQGRGEEHAACYRIEAMDALVGRAARSTVASLFGTAATICADHVAGVAGERSVTYRALDRRPR